MIEYTSVYLAGQAKTEQMFSGRTIARRVRSHVRNFSEQVGEELVLGVTPDGFFVGAGRDLSNEGAIDVYTADITALGLEGESIQIGPDSIDQRNGGLFIPSLSTIEQISATRFHPSTREQIHAAEKLIRRLGGILFIPPKSAKDRLPVAGGRQIHPVPQRLRS